MTSPDSAVSASSNWPPLRIAQWATVAALLVASLVVELNGRSGLSWAIDGVAIVVIGGFLLVRRRSA